MKIVISSGRGGTGKTTLSTNLASYWAETTGVVLVDLDVEEPNSGLFINGELIRKETKYKMVPEWNRDKCTQNGICKEVCNYGAIIRLASEVIVFPELCHSCYACVELCPNKSFKMIAQRIGELSHFAIANLNFIESRLNIGEEQAVPLIKQTKKYVEDNFDHNIIKIFDSPPGTSCPVIETVKDADLVILITEPTPFGLHDLKIAIETIQIMKKDMGVVINRWGIGDNNVELYCKNNDIPIIAKFPNSRAVAELYSKGELIYPKDNEFKEQLEIVKKFIMGRML